MRYIALVERATADFNGVCAEKYTEAYVIGLGESMENLFQRVKRDFPVMQIRVVPLNQINTEVES